MLMRPSTASVDQASLWSPDPHPFLRPQGSSQSGCREAPQPFVVAQQHRRAAVLLAAFDPVAQQFGAAVVEPRQLAAVDRDRLVAGDGAQRIFRSEEHPSELQSLMRISYAFFCLKKKKSTY